MLKKILTMLAMVALVLVSFSVVHSSAQADNGNEEPCVPKDAYTETSDWLLTSPGEGWYEVEKRTVVDKEAWDEVVSDGFQRYSWTGKQRAADNPPPFPHVKWQPNVKGDPHGIGVEGAYYVPKGKKSGAWFYLEALTKTIHHEAETHDEFKFAFDHAEVKCDTPSEEPTDPTETPTDPSTEKPDEPRTTDPNRPRDESGKPPVVIENHCSANKCVKVSYDEDGEEVDREVQYYPVDRKDEGL